jgi:hypothetical protein
MGVYIYRITPHVVTCSDGKPANVAAYAYKPGWGDSDVVANQLAARAFKAGKPLARVVLGDRDGRVDPTSPVYGNTCRRLHIWDDFDLGAPQFPRLDNVRVKA